MKIQQQRKVNNTLGSYKLKQIFLPSELNALIDDMAPESRQQTWQERQEVAQESWEHIRPTIFEEYVKHSALPSDGVSIILHFICLYVIMEFRIDHQLTSFKMKVIIQPSNLW